MPHVAGRVAQEGEPLPGQLAAVLLDGEQVGEGLAGVELVGERVDDGYAGVPGHLLETCLLVGAPHDDRGLATQDTRAVSGMDSRTPTWASEPSMIIGKPPSSEIPEANDACVRRVGLSKSTATVRGPASGFSSYGEAFSAPASASDACLGAGVEVVVAEEVAGHDAAP